MKKTAKKAALTLLKLIVSLGILAYIFTKFVDIRQLGTTLVRANWFYFTVAVIVYFLVQGLSAYRWHLLIKPQGLTVPFRKILAFYFLGMYFNFFLPSSIGGDVFKVYYLNKETNRLSACTASVLFDRDIGMGGVVVIAIFGLLFAGSPVKDVPLLLIFGLIALGFVLANLALFFRPTYNLLHRVLSMFKMKRVDEKIERLFDSFNVYRNRWGLIGLTMVMSLGVQIGCAMVNVLAAKAIGFDQASWVAYLIFIPTISLISMMPVSVGGTGWREGAYFWLFTQKSVGATPDQALALSVLWLGVVAITALPGGIIYVARGSRKDDLPPDDEGLFGDPEAIEETPRSEERFASLAATPIEEGPASTG